MFRVIRSEAALIIGAATTVIMLTVGDGWFYDLGNPFRFAGLFAWVFAVMVYCSFTVVRHADALAEILGEPYGTLILTISVIGIEVSVIGAVMLNTDADATLARDTMLAVVIIVMNGMVGLSLLIGGIRHREQDYNLQGTRAFLGVLVTLATITLILPRFTTSTPDGSLTLAQSVGFAIVTIALYGTFLAMQTTRHRSHFDQPVSSLADGGSEPDDRPVDHKKHIDLDVKSPLYHAIFLLLTLVPIVLLSKKFAVLTDFGLVTFGLPQALGGILVAVLVLTPEGMAALHAAAANQLQRSVNICLGSALATISLTVPAVLTIALFTGIHIELGLEHAELVLLILTLALGILSFGMVRTSMLQGAVHLVVFFVYLFLIFDP